MGLLKAIAAVTTAALLLAGAAARAEPVKIKVAWIVAPTDSPLAMLGKPGISRHEGKSYTLDYVHFTSTPAMITGLASGEVDLANTVESVQDLVLVQSKLGVRGISREHSTTQLEALTDRDVLG